MKLPLQFRRLAGDAKNSRKLVVCLQFCSNL
uniref:Uncharacterized protein n=1 Tax=Rhizophora mucronata TaxID=61149 RepID=A0A2P2PWX1_RHIMU